MSGRVSCPTLDRWIVQVAHLEHASDSLTVDNKEKAGAILFENEGFNSSRVITNSKGAKDSVSIIIQKDHMLSFHTHPVAAYVNAQCIYGHPSGDDLSEYCRLSVSGAINHAVFTVEGVYIIQVHPVFVNYLISLDTGQFNTLCEAIYDHFLIYHGRRGYIHIRDKEPSYTPHIFVDAVNTFQLSDAISTTKYRDRVMSCVWYYSDNYKLFRDRSPTDLWQALNNGSVLLSYKLQKEPVSFPFLSLNTDERTISQVKNVMQTCATRS